VLFRPRFLFGVRTAQDDIRSTARHVGGDGNLKLAPGLRNYGRFFFVVLGVEDLVGDVAPGQDVGQEFRFFN